MRQRLPLLVLMLAAVLPLAPSFVFFARHEFPPACLSDDGALMELATRQAVRGERLVGPYSRFGWSHPGPAVFYALAPAYELSGRKAGGLHLGALLLGTLSVAATVWLAARLGGLRQAALTAALLSVYLVALRPARSASEWGPHITILPFLLLLHLGALLAHEGWRRLPAFLALSSAIVQTHVAYAPACGALLVFAVLVLWRRREAPTRRTLALAAAAALVLWTPALLEELRPGRGNAGRLARFFLENRAGHTFVEVAEPLVTEAAKLPVQAARLLSIDVADERRLLAGTCFVSAVALLAAACSRARQPLVRLLAALSLVMLAVAALALQRIVGPIFDYLSLWVSAAGFLALSALATWALTSLLDRWPGSATPALVLFAGLSARCVMLNAAQIPAEPPSPSAPLAEIASLSDRIEEWARRTGARPLVHIVTHDTWIPAAGVVNELSKRGVPISVEERWLFLFGRALAPKGTENASLLLGDARFDAELKARPDHLLVASSERTFAYTLEDPGWLAAHTLRARLRVVSARGAVGNPALAVDGVTPPEGTAWDDGLSVRFEGEGSGLTLELPPQPTSGLVLQADNNDTYRVESSADGSSWEPAGEAGPREPAGLRQRVLLSGALANARFVRITPVEGDGVYVIGEVRALTGKVGTTPEEPTSARSR